MRTMRGDPKSRRFLYRSTNTAVGTAIHTHRTASATVKAATWGPSQHTMSVSLARYCLVATACVWYTSLPDTVSPDTQLSMLIADKNTCGYLQRHFQAGQQ